MSNPHYTRVFDVMPGAFIRSDPIEQELTLIQQGFDSVDAKDDQQDAELALKAPIASPALTGAPTAPTPPTDDASTRIATTDFVAQRTFAVSLPGQGGNAGKVLRTDGATASWEPSPLRLVRVTGTSVDMQHGDHYVLLNPAASLATAPASPTAGMRFRVSPGNGRQDNTVNWNGAKHEGNSDATTTIDLLQGFAAEYVDGTFGWKVMA